MQDKLNLFISEHEEVLQQQLAQTKIFSLPKRVHLEFPGGNLTYTDYLTSEEPLEVMRFYDERIIDLSINRKENKD